MSLILLTCAGCSAGPLEIAGTYTDQWGSSHTITDTAWDIDWPASYDILEYDNAGRFLIAANDADNEFDGGYFSRMDWVEHEGHTWYCQTTFDAETEDEARDTARGDDSDPTTGGCGVGTWTDLTP